MKNGLMLVPAMLLIVFAACKKSDEPSGKGGSAILHLIPQHHNKDSSLFNLVVYIKYNTSDAASSYDDSAVCVRGADYHPVGTFSGLKKGPYYLYGKGFDTSWHQSVHGGISYTIVNENEQTVYLPVSE